MKTIEFKFRLAQGGAAAVALGLAMAGQSAMACNADNWFDKTDATVLASGPGSQPSISRYSGLCAMQTSAGSEAWVEDDSPGGIDRIRARFYVLADNTETARIYRGFNAGGSAIFNVALNPNNGNIVFLSSGESVVCAGCATAGSWNSIEVDWDAGAGNISLSANGAAPVSTSITSAETVSKVRLGNLNSAGGVMNFDAYESRRTTEIGRLLRGDANSDGNVNVGDITAVSNEIFATPFASGQPDCNEDGNVNVGDITCLANDIF